MNRDIERWGTDLAKLNSRVSPIAEEPVDPETLDAEFDSNQEKTLQDVANDAQTILCEIIDRYISGDDCTRDAIRQLFVKHDSFAWAAYYRMKDRSSCEVRRYLAFLSIEDQGRDTRDYLLHCSAVFKNFDKSGIAYKDELREIVSISRNHDKYGMGSTADILQKWC